MRKKHAAYQKKIALKSRMQRERAWQARIKTLKARHDST